jgi:hypothetical protein
MNEATEALHTPREGPILSRHLLEKEPISNLWDERGLQPTILLPPGRRNRRTGCSSTEGYHILRPLGFKIGVGIVIESILGQPLH